MMLRREFSIGSTYHPKNDIFITYLVDIILVLLGEILSWSLVGLKDKQT